MTKWDANLATGARAAPQEPEEQAEPRWQDRVAMEWKSSSPSSRSGYDKQVEMLVYLPYEVSEYDLAVALFRGLEAQAEEDDDNDSEAMDDEDRNVHPGE